MRNRQSKHIFVILAILAVTILFINALLASEDKVLRIGITPNYPPIVFKYDGDYAGLDIELAKMLAKELDLEFVFVELPWDSQIQSLIDKKIDIIMSGMSIVDSRKLKIGFTEPYLRTWQMALIRNNDLDKYNDMESIRSIEIKIGVEKGTTGEDMAAREFPLASIMPYIDKEQAMDDLIKGDIDIYIHDALEIWWLFGEYEEKGLRPSAAIFDEEYLGWGVRKEDKELLESINNILRSWKESKRLDARIKFWVPYVELYGGEGERLY
ncbi:MAG: transporter substrate-binding domain-containing protein [Candidatus Omnitrophota bacterium]